MSLITFPTTIEMNNFNSGLISLEVATNDLNLGLNYDSEIPE